MAKRMLSLLMLVVLGLLITGCGNETKPASKVDITDESKATDIIQEAVSTLVAMSDEVENFPEGVPLPESYIVNVDMNMGGIRNVVLEIGESDLRAMVERFNKEIVAAGHSEDILEELEKDETGLYTVTGTIVANDGSHVMITIGEYEPGGARVEGNTGSITYMIY